MSSTRERALASRESEPDPQTVGCPLCAEAGGDASVCAFCAGARAPGGYRTTRVIAETPYTRMYEAVDEAGRKVALKELHFACVPGAKELDAFEREAKLLAALDHPQIPKVLGFFREGRGANTRLYLAQEFVDGESLLQRLAHQRVDEREALEIARKIIPILEYMHGRAPSVVHRDVKPANVMRRPDGTLVLVDFGAARDLARGVTHGATLVGTFGYMPLEQLGGTVDPTVDVYALGMTLVHLVSGKVPADLITADGRVDVRKHLAGVPRLERWLARACAPRREDRFPTARAALEALDAPDAVREAAAPPVAFAAPPAAVTAAPVAVTAAPAFRHCAACGVAATGGAMCPACGAALEPTGLVVERALAQVPGEGRTYLCRDASGARVVVREHLVAADADPPALAAHVAAIEALMRAPIPGVARIRAVQLEGPPEDRRLFVVREHVVGTELAARPRKHSPSEVTDLVLALALVIRDARARREPVVLGTIHPRNLVREPSGVWTLTDTLLSADLPRALRRSRDFRHVRRTTADDLLPFQPPAGRGLAPDATWDVYAAGVVGLVAANGADRPTDDLVAVLRTLPAPEGWSTRLAGLVRRMASVDAVERNGVLVELDQVIAELRGEYRSFERELMELAQWQVGAGHRSRLAGSIVGGGFAALATFTWALLSGAGEGFLPGLVGVLAVGVTVTGLAQLLRRK